MYTGQIPQRPEINRQYIFYGRQPSMNAGIKDYSQSPLFFANQDDISFFREIIIVFKVGGTIN